jgi:hypothetical protein
MCRFYHDFVSHGYDDCFYRHLDREGIVHELIPAAEMLLMCLSHLSYVTCYYYLTVSTELTFLGIALLYLTRANLAYLSGLATLSMLPVKLLFHQQASVSTTQSESVPKRFVCFIKAGAFTASSAEIAAPFGVTAQPPQPPISASISEASQDKLAYVETLLLL